MRRAAWLWCTQGALAQRMGVCRGECAVLPRQGLQMRHQLGLGERLGQAERTGETKGLRDSPEQVIDRAAPASIVR